MRSKMILIFAYCLFTACQVDENTPVTPVSDTFDPTTAVLIKQGTLMGVGHTASGVASVYESNGKYTVYFNPFSSQNGPDLKVYLSKDVDASEYIRLGKLKSIMGMQSYEVPSGVSVKDYQYVHIWCEKYSVVFAVAEMQ